MDTHTQTHLDTYTRMHTHTYIHGHTYTAQRRDWKLSFIRQSVEAVSSTVVKLNIRKELNTNTTEEGNPCNFLHTKFKEKITQPIFSCRMETQTTAMPCLLMTIQKMGCDGPLMPWVVFTTFQHQRENITMVLSWVAFWLLQIQLRKQPASLLSSKRMVKASLLWRIHSTTWMPSTDIPNEIFAFSILCDLSRKWQRQQSGEQGSQS